MQRIAVTGGSGLYRNQSSGSFVGARGCRTAESGSGAAEGSRSTIVLGGMAICFKRREVLAALQRFEPTKIVHLGGRTDMLGNTLEDYAANHVGTQNVIAAIQQIPSVQRVVFTSSQFVVGPGELPKNDLDFRPHTNLRNQQGRIGEGGTERRSGVYLDNYPTDEYLG